ncbi:molecular chaperone [Tropicimonas sp. IMCC6043]|uniref:TorD/DmsD family molecular chaperone n=1 Tax=Tropicimonas sp. IMCC6043 TaxID=2510645 RepID=UPI00101CC02D|nr:molecular chaperone TorD family protein [Tropicimonas sp. IMCC6043]RYH11608.1 hypothetical protein EU800_02930 [Tropicimonas sp. IMCC6043]
MTVSTEDRQQIDRWLAGLFLGEVDREAIDLYRGADGAALLDQLAALPSLAPLVAALRETVCTDQDPDSLRLDLAAAYGKLFLTGGPRAVPLFASAYLSERGLLMQEPARQSAVVLSQLDMSPPPGFREPLDHIGIELNILAELAGGRGDAGLTEASYLRDHLLTWVPTLAALCARLAPIPLYRELGPATLAWLRAVETQLAVAA